MADVDQAVVDEILAKAAEDTEEGRLEKLEREVETLKGSIKRLLLDIRETMNKLENPFANLQSLAESGIVPQSTPQIQVVPAKIPEIGEKSRTEEEAGEKKEEEGDMRAEVEKGEEQIIPALSPKEEKIPEKRVEREAGKRMEVEKKTDVKKKMDLLTLFRLMEWVQSMVSRHSYDSFKLMLEIFGHTGYISDETRDLILKLAELAKLDGRELFVDLYRLHRILNPDDRSLDSDLLALLLEKR